MFFSKIVNIISKLKYHKYHDYYPIYIDFLKINIKEGCNKTFLKKIF